MAGTARRDHAQYDRLTGPRLYTRHLWARQEPYPGVVIAHNTQTCPQTPNRPEPAGQQRQRHGLTTHTLPGSASTSCRKSAADTIRGGASSRGVGTSMPASPVADYTPGGTATSGPQSEESFTLTKTPSEFLPLMVL